MYGHFKSHTFDSNVIRDWCDVTDMSVLKAPDTLPRERLNEDLLATVGIL